MKIYILSEDHAKNESFRSEHGLSILIVTAKHKILFDAGQSDAFIENASRMGISLEDVDLFVLSHGHYDHGNGISEFLKINTNAKIYLRTEALSPFFHNKKFIGLTLEVLLPEERVMLLSGSDPYDIDDEIRILPAKCLAESTSEGFYTANGNLDVFDHEQYLSVTEENNRVFFTGCAHRGIDQIASLAHRYNATDLIGGFHLSDDLSVEDVEAIATGLSKLPIRYYTGHCTGEKAYSVLENTLKKRVCHFSCGDRFVIGTHAEKAKFLFRQGYNCSQSVFGAFADDMGIDIEMAMKLSCSFGGGLGRLRETCGAVSGMLMVCGMKKGYATPETGKVKAEHYALVQSLVGQFREANGAIVCREILGKNASTSPIPTERTEAFYKTRPCERCIGSAAEIAEKMLF